MHFGKNPKRAKDISFDSATGLENAQHQDFKRYEGEGISFFKKYKKSHWLQDSARKLLGDYSSNIKKTNKLFWKIEHHHWILHIRMGFIKQCTHPHSPPIHPHLPTFIPTHPHPIKNVSHLIPTTQNNAPPTPTHPK